MKRLALIAALVATNAEAAHCPHGQLWRIHMGRCVSLGSPLAWPYEAHRRPLAAFVVLPPSHPIQTPEEPWRAFLRQQLALPPRLGPNDLLLFKAGELREGTAK